MDALPRQPAPDHRQEEDPHIDDETDAPQDRAQNAVLRLFPKPVVIFRMI
jgi:hypothetical protein